MDSDRAEQQHSGQHSRLQRIPNQHGANEGTQLRPLSHLTRRNKRRRKTRRPRERVGASRVFPDKESLMAGALEMAQEIAARSPVAVQGTKVNLVYSRDHSVTESLNYMATWNMSMLQTQDVMKSAQAAIEKKSPKEVVFSKL